MIAASLTEQQRQQDARWLANQTKAADARMQSAIANEDDLESRLVRIFLEGKDLGLGDEPVGPIPVLQDVPLDAVEKSIQEWISANVSGAAEIPEGGYLKLAFDGADLDTSKTLMELQGDGLAIGNESVINATQGTK